MSDIKKPILDGDQFIEISEGPKLRPIGYEQTQMQAYKSFYACEFGCKLQKVSDEDRAKTQKARKQLFLAAGFCVLFMIVEVVGGFLANSLALLSDATHLLSDCAGLMISITALWLVQKEATGRYSFGYHRAEIIGALFSIMLIWGLTVWLVVEAITRLITKPDVDGKIMFIVACLGILVNIIMGAILFQGGHHSHGLGGGGHAHDDKSHGHQHKHSHTHSHGGHSHGAHDHKHSHKHSQDHGKPKNTKGDQRNINVRSAFIHVLGDLVQSIGVVIAAALIWADHQLRLLDPICTLIFSVIVVFTTTTLVRDALDVLMENVPKHIDLEKLTSALQELPDVAAVHDLHVWNLSVGKPALSVHLLAKSSTYDIDGKIIPACADGILRKAQKVCSNDFHIQHSTIQIEYPRGHHTKIKDASCPPYCADGRKDSDEQENHHAEKTHKHEHNDKEKTHKHDEDHDHDENPKKT